MAFKTWFQHDMNASTKDGLSALISCGGFDAYGRFWAFKELFYSMQINRDEFSETIRINEHTLLKQLHMNCRSLPKLLQLFHDTLGIVFQKNTETYGIFYETTVPKSLIYITKRSQKKRHLDLDLDLELELDNKKKKKKKNPPIEKEKNEKYKPINDCSFFDQSEFKEAWNSWQIVRQKKKCSNSDRAIKNAVKKLMDLSGDNVNIAIKILDQSSDKGYSDLWPLKNNNQNERKAGW